MEKKNENLALAYVVTCFGKVVGVYANADDAFQAQMNLVNKGRIAELVPSPVIYPLKAKS